jgi:hypothetical protein
MRSVWRILGQDDRGEGLWLMKMGMSEVATKKYNKQSQPQRSWRLSGKKDL